MLENLKVVIEVVAMMCIFIGIALAIAQFMVFLYPAYVNGFIAGAIFLVLATLFIAFIPNILDLFE